MITQKRNKWVTAWFCRHAARLLQKNFRKLSFTAESPIPAFEPGVPVIAAMNHSSWWDALLAMYLAYFVFQKEFYGIMAEEQLRRYGIFRYAGVYSVDRNSPREGRAFLEYTRSVLAGTGRLLWIYPQGDLVSAEVLPVDLKKGFAQIVSLFPRVHLLKMIVSYDFWVESKPEIVIDLLPLETMEPGRGRLFAEGLAERVGSELTGSLDRVRAIVRSRNAAVLRPVFVSDRGTHPVYDMYRRAKSAMRGETFTVRHGTE